MTDTGERVTVGGKLHLAEGNESVASLKSALAMGVTARRIQGVNNGEKIRGLRGPGGANQAAAVGGERQPLAQVDLS